MAGIGNVLSHDYGHVAHDVLWRVVRNDLLELEKVCRDELAAELARKQQKSWVITESSTNICSGIAIRTYA